jgi:hypothetical protein
MTKQGRDRFCGECKTLVHDLSAMGRREAETFLANQVGKQICIKYAYDHLGNVRFAQSPAAVASMIPASMLLPSIRAIAAAAALAGTAYATQQERTSVTVESVYSPATVATEGSQTSPVATELDGPHGIFSISFGSELMGAYVGNESGWGRQRQGPNPVVIGTPNVDKSSIAPAILRRHLYRLGVERFLLANPKLHGSMTVTFTIKADGSAGNTRVMGIQKGIADYVVDAINRYQFPKLRGKDTNVSVVIEINPHK